MHSAADVTIHCRTLLILSPFSAFGALNYGIHRYQNSERLVIVS